MINTTKKKQFIKNKQMVIRSIMATINRGKPFSLVLRQFGYMDVMSIGWLSEDDQTVLSADIMTRCEPEIIDGKKYIFIKDLVLLGISEVIPSCYKSDRRLRLKDMQAEDFIPFIIEYECRYNEEHPDDPITHLINQNIIKKVV